jgi:drug/metabolite transporter (DMT)-like permease
MTSTPHGAAGTTAGTTARGDDPILTGSADPAVVTGRAAARPAPSDWAAMVALVIMWGGAFALMKVAVQEIPPLTVVGARIGLSGLILTLACYGAGRHLPNPFTRAGARLWGIYALLGIVGNTIPFTLITWAEMHISSAVAGILVAFMPLMTLILAGVTLRSEPVTPKRVAGFLLGFAGVVVLIGPGVLGKLGTGAVLAQLAVLAGAACYAANTVMTRVIDYGGRWAAAAGLNLAAGVFVIVASLIVDAPWSLRPEPGSMLAVLALAVGPSALATVLLLKVIASAGPTFMAYVNYLVPLAAVGFGTLFLAERPGPEALVALGLILAGLGVGQIRWRGLAGALSRADRSPHRRAE